MYMCMPPIPHKWMFVCIARLWRLDDVVDVQLLPLFYSRFIYVYCSHNKTNPAIGVSTVLHTVFNDKLFIFAISCKCAYGVLLHVRWEKSAIETVQVLQPSVVIST